MSNPNPLPTHMSLLSEDKNTVSYRPHLTHMTGRVTTAILLQQVLNHWNTQGRTAFYKFKEPCDSSYYQAGHSWCEELAFTRHEFNGALKPIATKVTHGQKKADLMGYQWPSLPDDPASEEYQQLWAEAIRHLVIYWTDSDRRTWYWVNWELLTKALSITCSDKAEKRLPPQTAQSGFTSDLDDDDDDSDSSPEGSDHHQTTRPPLWSSAALEIVQAEWRGMGLSSPLRKKLLQQEPEYTLALITHAKALGQKPAGLLRTMLNNRDEPAAPYLEQARSRLQPRPIPAQDGQADRSPDEKPVLDRDGRTDPLPDKELALDQNGQVDPSPTEKPALVKSVFKPPEIAADLKVKLNGGNLSVLEVWLMSLDQLQLQLNRATFDTWLKGAEAANYADGTLTVRVRHVYAASWLEQHLAHAVNATCSSIAGAPIRVQYIVQKMKSEKAASVALVN